MSSSPASGARKESPLKRKAQPLPRAVIRTPATAGPIMRALWKLAELRETVLRMSAGPTMSTTKAWRVGLSTS